MRAVNETLAALKNGEYDDKLRYMYACKGDVSAYADRYAEVIGEFIKTYGDAPDIALFSAPGRTEIGGNHTDHQHGCVIAGAVNLDVIAAARPNGTNTVRVQSRNYKMDVIELDDLGIHEEQFDKAIALIRGTLKYFVDKGYDVKGFDAYTISNVLKGSGMSSDAFEVLIGTIVNNLFGGGEISPVEIAQIGQYAENVYFNKPCGLMDQMASSVGSAVAIDFNDTSAPVVEKVDFDLAGNGYALCIIDSGADHADLTDEYAAVPKEMKEAAGFFGKEYLRDVNPADFFANIKNIREKIHNDRAVLRAFHFFRDNNIAREEADALKTGDFDRFLSLVRKSGQSSFMYLQNVYSPSAPGAQAVAVVLAMCDELLGGRGAYRVHGGGFAGTVQAFVPLDMLDEFKAKIEAVTGEGMCHVLSVRPVGGYELK